MSFGWSAGDIAVAVKLIYRLFQALDDVDGSASDYCETVSFLRGFTRSLEPLQAFTAWKDYPEYHKEISEQVALVKSPITDFLDITKKYEPTLGDATRKGCHRRIIPKLKWYAFTSKKALALKRNIESHMRIIDMLMQRLTLDVLYSTQERLPHNLRSAFHEVVAPELVSFLKEHVKWSAPSIPPYLNSVQRSDDATMLLEMSELHNCLSSGFRKLDQELEHQSRQHELLISCLKGHGSYTIRDIKDAAAKPEDKILHIGPDGLVKSTAMSEAQWQDLCVITKEICYYVLLCLLSFWKALHSMFSLVVPSRPLTRVLLAKYNICFLDAIGRPPGILPFDMFRSFKMLQVFIDQEFKDLPRSALVTAGSYLVTNLSNNQILQEDNWNTSVAPGSTLSMSVVLRKRRVLSSNTQEQHCTDENCLGSWKRQDSRFLYDCPICGKEVVSPSVEPSEARRIMAHATKLKHPMEQQPKDPDPKGNSLSKNSHEKSISIFKRVVQLSVLKQVTRQIVHGTSDIPLVLASDFRGAYNMLNSHTSSYFLSGDLDEEWIRVAIPRPTHNVDTSYMVEQPKASSSVEKFQDIYC